MTEAQHKRACWDCDRPNSKAPEHQGDILLLITQVVEELKRDPTLKEYAKEQMLNSQAWKDAQSSDRKDRRALLEAANKELQ